MSKDINPQSMMLMTTTRGGEKASSESKRRDIYQYLLTTRDRIYTKEDIKLFCRCYYGDYFNNVKIESGYEVSNIPKHGIIKVTKVILDGVGQKLNVNKEIFREELLTGLIRRSLEDMEYRIIIE